MFAGVCSYTFLLFKSVHIWKGLFILLVLSQDITFVKLAIEKIVSVIKIACHSELKTFYFLYEMMFVSISFKFVEQLICTTSLNCFLSFSLTNKERKEVPYFSFQHQICCFSFSQQQLLLKLQINSDHLISCLMLWKVLLN